MIGWFATKFDQCTWPDQHSIFLVFTARVRSTREGNVLTRVCPSINLSVHRGGYPYPIMLCNISQNAMRQWGGVPGPPRGGTRVRYPPGGVPGPPVGGVPGSGTPPGDTRVRYPPRGGIWVRYPPGGTRVRYPPGGTRVRYPPGGYPGQVPPGGGGYPGQVPPPGGGTRVGQQKEYSLHGGRYASCVHAGGLSCWICFGPK